MRIIEILRAVLADAYANKSRAYLTTLGIIVGALAIALVVGVGSGGEKAIQEQLISLNPALVMAWSDNHRYQFNLETMHTVQNLPAIADATLSVRNGGQISYRSFTTWSGIVGVFPDYVRVADLSLSAGTFFNSQHSEDLSRVAVIGFSIVEQLFEGQPTWAVGSSIKIEGKSYEVIGTIDRGENWDGDSVIYIPYTTATRYTFTANSGWPQLITVAKDLKQVEEAVEKMRQVFVDQFDGSRQEDFYVYDAGNKFNAAKNAEKTMRLLLISVAALVLFAGGIGIMNVLLVSIKERTREIGILKAIGARRRDILLQFLLQAVLISVIGGAVGVGLSVAVGSFIKRFDVAYNPSLFGAGIALLFSLLTGTFFGYYPAVKAAALRPIDALNEE